MKYYSVIGGGYGDEAKGTCVDYLARTQPNPVVIRHSGGHQVGHGVMHDGKVHEFRHFGSGTFRGIPTYWNKECTVFPISFEIEFKKLAVEFQVTPEIYFNMLCPVTTIYDVAYNRAVNAINKHGSVGMGFAATLKRHQIVPLFMFDLYHPFALGQKLENIENYYKSQMTDIQIFNEFRFQLMKAKFTKEDFVSSCHFMIEHSKTFTNEAPVDKFHTVIFEGNQGILLDKDHGFFPNVTYGHTTNATVSQVDNVFYPTRCYSTRHGFGPLQNEGVSTPILKNNQWETNFFNPYQGDFRISLLSFDHLRYAIQADSHYLNKNTKKTLVITCMDQIDEPLITVGKTIVPLKAELFKGLVDEVIYNYSPSSETFTFDRK